MTSGQVSSAEESDSEEFSGRVAVGHLEDSQHKDLKRKIQRSFPWLQIQAFQNLFSTAVIGIK